MGDAPTAEQSYYSPEALGRFAQQEDDLRRQDLAALGQIRLVHIAAAHACINEHGQGLIASPLFGAWLDRITQAWVAPWHGEGTNPELVRRICYAGNYAAAAALAAGQEIETLVLPQNGSVIIPELGRIIIAGHDEQFIPLQVNDGVTIGEGPHSMRLTKADMEEPSPRWEPLRYVGPPDFEIPLNDIDPNRAVFRYPVAERLSDAHYNHWRTVFGEAWDFIKQHDPAAAAIVRAGLVAIVPAPTEPLTHGKSMAAGAAFGVIGINECRDPQRLASHIIFGMRKHLAIALKAETQALSFFEDDPHASAPIYPPSREGRASVPHLLEDGFLNVGLARYFANVAASAPSGLQPYAQLSFARWFVESRQNLQGLQQSGYQKPENAVLTAALEQEFAKLAGQYMQTPEPLKQIVAANSADRYLSWRMYNSTPEPEAVHRLRHAWLRGDPAPAAVVPANLSDSIAAYKHIGQRTRYVLQESRIKDPQHFAAAQRGKADPSRFGRPTPGDIAFAGGDVREARNYFRAAIQDNPHNKEAWAGFALTFERDTSPVARILLQSPELAAAVYAAIGNRDIPPEEIAAWLQHCKVQTAIDR